MRAHLCLSEGPAIRARGDYAEGRRRKGLLKSPRGRAARRSQRFPVIGSALIRSLFDGPGVGSRTLNAFSRATVSVKM
ncbi:hypothetical protein EVAR_61955_1 [Eumeta japonica]|uniref:Uncharacterized protein n=1 Tax=Eumeta variegata TaxID=151549 RepID=A0A4C1ZP79_EUMVA|nr:hypothetical protein EVAR_61955_1 [Eumeta japonica]